MEKNRRVFTIYFDLDDDGNISPHATGQPEGKKQYMGITRALGNYHRQFIEICNDNKYYPSKIQELFNRASYDYEDGR